MARCTIRSRRLGIPSGRSLPFAFGIYTRRAGSGLYEPANSSSRIVVSSCWRFASIMPLSTPSTPGVRAPLEASVMRAASFSQPLGNESQEAIELALFVLRRPYRQLALHFTDYQRSSPHCGQLIHPAIHFNCLPSPCGRLSRPRTTTEAPPACTASGAHSLGICADLPQFTCRTQRMGEVACRSLYPCVLQVVAGTTV
jgi:hypothetical protein